MSYQRLIRIFKWTKLEYLCWYCMHTCVESTCFLYTDKPVIIDIRVSNNLSISKYKHFISTKYKITDMLCLNRWVYSIKILVQISKHTKHQYQPVHQLFTYQIYLTQQSRHEFLQEFYFNKYSKECSLMFKFKIISLISRYYQPQRKVAEFHTDAMQCFTSSLICHLTQSPVILLSNSIGPVERLVTIYYNLV